MVKQCECVLGMRSVSVIHDLLILTIQENIICLFEISEFAGWKAFAWFEHGQISYLKDENPSSYKR